MEFVGPTEVIRVLHGKGEVPVGGGVVGGQVEVLDVEGDYAQHRGVRPVVFIIIIQRANNINDGGNKHSHLEKQLPFKAIHEGLCANRKTNKFNSQIY